MKYNIIYITILCVLIAISISSHIDSKAKISSLENNMIVFGEGITKVQDVLIRSLERDSAIIMRIGDLQKQIDSLKNIQQ